jgi:hypothetical protein
LVIDAPEIAKVAGVLSSPEDGEYLLQPDVDVEALDEAALYCGGWYLYASPKPESTPEVLRAFHASDVFRISPADLTQLLARLGLTFLIASFYDDNEWRLAAPLEITTEVAA